tara:strand:+ start:23 stop:385 length:363 start_codon:yes stop_codon:yes gene_type:complete
MKLSFVPILACTCILLCFSAFAEEARAINLFKEVRCLVCQGQTIHESNAEIAEDLKTLIREKIVEGKTDKEIKGFLVEKYGDWILMTPPVKELTYVLWFTPIIFMAIGLIVIFRRKKEKA